MAGTEAVLSEIAHFDALVSKQGESWWGHATPAGVVRLARRARIVIESLPAGPTYRVLEIAAGAGALTEAVLHERPDGAIVATDVSPASVHRLAARLRPFENARAELANAMSLPYNDATFDAAIGNSALHHVDVSKALAELFRVLKPGGRLLVFEPNLLNPQVFWEMDLARSFARSRLQYSENEQTYARWTYRRCLRQAGFRDAYVRPFDFLHPLTPASLLPVAKVAGRCAERVPLLREIAGSLCLSGTR